MPQPGKRDRQTGIFEEGFQSGKLKRQGAAVGSRRAGCKAPPPTKDQDNEPQRKIIYLIDNNLKDFREKNIYKTLDKLNQINYIIAKQQTTIATKTDGATGYNGH